MHFSFFTFFSDFVIFQVVKWMFLIFHDFQFSCHIPCPTLTFLNFPLFSVFLAIFHVLKCVFLIFRDFQFSRHIPCPTVDISKFSTFFSFPRHISLPESLPKLLKPQTASTWPIHMEEMHIDALAFTGHKGLSGPQGIGGFLLRWDGLLRHWDRQAGQIIRLGASTIPSAYILPELLPAYHTGSQCGVIPSV